MATPTGKEFLGTGPSFPMRIGGRGLPDIELSSGLDAVRDAIQYLLSTFPGELPFDPRVGLDPEQFRFDPNDQETEDAIRESIAISLIEVEPRVRDVEVDITRDEEGGVSDVSISYTVISEQVEGNLVRLPRRAQDEAVRPDSDRSRSGVFGYHSATADAFGIG
jgi:phage baseplate assembly protein W